jgi:Protein of unknown function with PCYCGC motif
MTRLHKTLGAITLLTLAFGLAQLPETAARQSSSAPPPAAASESIPAFHSAPPTGPLPETLSPSLFSDPLAQNAYTLAARVKKVLYQQPCYCHCDRSEGHTSLLDCFTGHHAAVCGTCERESLYTYEQTQKGKTPAQIRDAIEHGKWQKMDVSKYQVLLPAK